MLLTAGLATSALAQPPTAAAAAIASPAQAVAIALARSPILRSAGAERAAVYGDSLAAPLRPNPEASLVIENFGGIGGKGDYRGATSMETTLSLSQRVELGGKRNARIELAGRKEGVANLAYEAARLDLARDIVTALADAEAAARAVGIEQERLRQASETVRIARGRVEAGKDPDLQAQRSEVTRVTSAVAVERARREAAIALRSLAVLMGMPQVTLAPNQSWYEDIGADPPRPLPADPVQRLEQNPDVVRLNATVSREQANLRLQRSNATPDVTLQGAVRRFQEGRETAFLAGVSIPLPFSDRNQGGIARAQAELLRAEAEAERGKEVLIASLTAAEQRLDAAWSTAQTLRRSAIPAADRAARLATAGFAAGKSTFLEALDAQRTASDARAQLNDALRDVHARRAEVERLRGMLPTNVSQDRPSP